MYVNALLPEEIRTVWHEHEHLVIEIGVKVSIQRLDVFYFFYFSEDRCICSKDTMKPVLDNV